MVGSDITEYVYFDGHPQRRAEVRYSQPEMKRSATRRIGMAYTNGPNWGEMFTIDAWGNLTNRNPYPGKTNYEGGWPNPSSP